MNDEATYQAEMSLIGSLMKNPRQFETVKDMLKREDFNIETLRWVWDALHSLSSMRLGIDTITIGDELERKGTLADFGIAGKAGRAALSYIRDEGTPSNAEAYAITVLDYSAKRKILTKFSDFALQALNGRRASELQSDILAQIADIVTPNHLADTHTMTLGRAVSDAMDETTQSHQGGRRIVPTGFCDLDHMLDDGFSPPDVAIVAARPGQGKTALLLNIAYNAAKKEKKNVAFFSLEMANTQLAMRMIAMESGVTFGTQRRGNLSETDWPAYTNAIAHLEALPIQLCDLPAISIRQMRRVLRTLEAQHGDMDLVVLDYLQLADAEGRYETRQLEVSRVSAGLKEIAKEFGVPVLAAAQLSRAVESRSDRRPILSDLRESGSIENDADLVMFIYRPDQYDPNSPKKNTAEIIIAKHRNGRVGNVELVFRPDLTKFENAYLSPAPDTRRKDIF